MAPAIGGPARSPKSLQVTDILNMAPYLNMSGVTEAAEVGGSDTKALEKNPYIKQNVISPGRSRTKDYAKIIAPLMKIKMLNIRIGCDLGSVLTKLY